MNEFTIRLLVLVALAALVAVAIWRQRRIAEVRPTPVARPDLGAGIHFFASSTCRPCLDARKVLTQAYGERFVEISYEDDPTRFGRLGISSVPTVMVLDGDGNGLRWEGVPRASDLPR